MISLPGKEAGMTVILNPAARIFAAIVLIVVSATQLLAAGRCETELETLKSIASNIDVQFQSDDVIAAGDPINVAWSRDGNSLPEGVTAWLVIVSIDQVRYSGAGFYPLPGGTPGPLDIGFADKWMRAIVPLHTADAANDGSFGIRPYREGNFGLSWTVMAKSSCGEHQLREVGTYKVVVEARHPQIVVQDLYDYSRPSSIIRTVNDRYELRVFDGFYQVFDRRYGGKVLDRRGYCPDFSPSGRFVAALAGRSDGSCNFNTAGENKPKFEVIDLVSGDVIANPDPPALWAHGDALMVVPSKWWKMLQGPGYVTSLLVDGANGTPERLIELGDSDSVAIDTANGYLYRIDKHGDADPPEPRAVFSLGGGGEISEREIGWNAETEKPIVEGLPVEALLASIERSSGTGPVLSEVYNDPQISISHRRHIDDPLAVFSDGEDEGLPLVARTVDHPTVESGEVAASSDDRILTASLLRGASVLGSARSTGRTIETLVNDHLGTSFSPQLTAANPMERITERMWEIDKLNVSDDEKRARFDAFKQKTIDPVVAQLKNEIPAAGRVMGQTLGCWPSGDVAYESELIGTWRIENSDRVVWLTHAGCQGIGTVGNLALNQIDLFLLEDGQRAHFNLIFDRQFYCAGNNADCEYVHQDDETGEEFTKQEQSYGQLTRAGNLPEDRFGAKIPQSFQQLIEFDSLTPAFLDDRYLLLPIGRKMFVVDLDNRSMSGPIDLEGDASKSRFSVSRDQRHFMQVNEDGSLAIHDFESGKVVLKGRYVDDEIVIWDRFGHYLSTYEGAQYVHMRFVGRPELYSLERMAGRLNRPDVVRAALDTTKPVTRPDLPAPPRLSAELAEDQESGTVAVLAEARSPGGLGSLRLFADGVLFRTIELEGTEWEDRIEIENLGQADWLSLVAVDDNGFQSAAQEIRLPDRQADGGKLYVIAIGTDTYEDEDRLTQLNFAASDARNFADAVSASATDRYDDIEVIGPFLDSNTLNADLESALTRIGRQSGPGDTVMVFVAGHGIRGDDGRFYLATRSTRLDDLAASGLSWQGLAEALAKLETRTFIFLDACHSGSVGNATNDGAADALLNAADGSITVIAASKGRQYSLESPAVGGGYFTSAIASIIGRRGDPDVDRDRSGTLDLDELYLALKRQVVEATDGRQTPWIARAQVVGKTPLL